MSLTKILTAVLFVTSGILFWFLYNGIDSVVENRERIALQEGQLIERFSCDEIAYVLLIRCTTTPAKM